MKYSLISVDKIKTSHAHSKTRCKQGEIVILAKSIQKFGVIEPILVKPLSGGDAYEIISGNRRFCASILLGMKEIPCIIAERSKNSPLMEISLMRFINHDAFDVAEKIKRILIENGWSAEILAEKTGLEAGEIVEFLSPAQMTGVERELAWNLHLSNDAIRRISTLQNREDRIRRLLAYKRIMEYPDRKAPTKPNIKARRRVSFGGLGFFENTIKKSLELLEKAGIRAKTEAKESANGIEYKIFLNK